MIWIIRLVVCVSRMLGLIVVITCLLLVVEWMG